LGSGNIRGRNYIATLDTQTIFQGTIDGVMVNAQFTPLGSGDFSGIRYIAVELWDAPLIPEPSSGLLAGTVVAAVGAFFRALGKR